MAVAHLTLVLTDMVARSRFPEADFNQRQLCLESRPQGHDPVHRHAVLHVQQDLGHAVVHEMSIQNPENVHDRVRTDVENKDVKSKGDKHKNKEQSNLFLQAGEQGRSLSSVSSPLRMIKLKT